MTSPATVRTGKFGESGLNVMQSLQSALGVVAIVAIAFIVSENHRAVPWRPVIIGLALTFALALLMLKIPQTEIAFGWINRAVAVAQ